MQEMDEVSMKIKGLLAGTSLVATSALAQQSPEDAAAGALACAGCGGVSLLLIVLPLAIAIAIAIWMYKDAVRRNDSNAIIWLIVGLVFPIIGLIIYLIVRNQNPAPPAPPAPPAV